MDLLAISVMFAEDCMTVILISAATSYVCETVSFYHCQKPGDAECGAKLLRDFF